jgi:hypothetical protein
LLHISYSTHLQSETIKQTSRYYGYLHTHLCQSCTNSVQPPMLAEISTKSCYMMHCQLRLLLHLRFAGISSLSGKAARIAPQQQNDENNMNIIYHGSIYMVSHKVQCDWCHSASHCVSHKVQC